MIVLKVLLEILGFAMLAAAAGLMAVDVIQYRRIPQWRLPARLALVSLIPLLSGFSIVVVPAGMAGVRVIQISGTLPETLYPGLHLVVPLVQTVETYDLRDQIYETTVTADSKKPEALKSEALKVQTKEGLELGLAVTVRFRLDPRSVAYIHANLPQPVEKELVPPVVATAFRDLTPRYLVRELFASKRDDIRREAAAAMTRKLAPDAGIVKEVMLRDIQLPAEYAKSLEGVLLKEQENEKLGVELEVKQKEVREAELEAGAQKARDVKAAEAQAEAKMIDGKAELEKRKVMNQADLDRVQLLAKADADKMHLEGAALKENPLLIQKIIADKLSDKVQIMMVPSDGKFFFANDVLKSAMPQAVIAEPDDPAGAQRGSR